MTFSNILNKKASAASDFSFSVAESEGTPEFALAFKFLDTNS
jgi:hypothetical protein